MENRAQAALKESLTWALSGAGTGCEWAAFAFWRYDGNEPVGNALVFWLWFVAALSLINLFMNADGSDYKPPKRRFLFYVDRISYTAMSLLLASAGFYALAGCLLFAQLGTVGQLQRFDAKEVSHG